MIVTQVETKVFDKNFSYIVGDDNVGEVFLIDPGDFSLLDGMIVEKGYLVRGILLTHSHFDHAGQADEFAQRYGAPVYLHKNGRSRIKVGAEVKLVDDGDKIEIGQIVIEVMHTPGHIDDAVCYYIDGEGGKLFTGDTLFVEGCGRADLPGSDVDKLFESLKRLKKMDDRVEVYAGHDYGSKKVSTIGYEKEHNRFLQCKSLEEFKRLRLS